MFHPQMAKKLLPLVVIAALGYGAYYYFNLPPKSLVLTGIVTTHDVEVSPQIGGRIVSIGIKEGDEVKAGQLLAEIDDVSGSAPVTSTDRPRTTRVSSGSQPMNENRPQRSPCSTDSSRNPSRSPTNLANALTGVS